MPAKSLLLVCVVTALMSGPVPLAACNPASTSSIDRVAKAVKVAGMDKVPVVQKAVIPRYPSELREVGIQGMATVDMLIDSSGRVVATELVSATVPELGRLALAAAKDWTFEPASANGRSSTTWVRVPFDFVMPELVAINSR